MSTTDRSATGASSLTDAASAIEWPTIALFVIIHLAWLSVTFWWERLPAPVLFVLGGGLVAWHGSLQHEVIHGHPTPWRRLNAALASAPLSLWLPLGIYWRSHLEHHAAERLTDPAHDPESRYLAQGAGVGYRVRRRLAVLQATLLGRLAVGPVIEIGLFLAAQLHRLTGDDVLARRAWLLHLLSLAPLLLWLHFACSLSLVRYGLCFVYPGTALSLLRSYAEHRSAPAAAERVAVVERAPLFGLLFLNNNLHAAHHAWPQAPWYALPRLYRERRSALLAANGGLVYQGYADVARRFLLRAHDRIAYAAPGGPAERQAA